MANVVLTYDLHGAEPLVYRNLDVALHKRHFVKEKGVDTVWKKTYADGIMPTETQAKKDFESAAREAGAVKYTAKFFISGDQIHVASITTPLVSGPRGALGGR